MTLFTWDCLQRKRPYRWYRHTGSPCRSLPLVARRIKIACSGTQPSLCWTDHAWTRRCGKNSGWPKGRSQDPWPERELGQPERIMSDQEQDAGKRDSAEIEREILARRKFSLADAIGRLGGSDLLKGASPVTRKRQAALQIEQYLERHLIDSQGALLAVLLRRVRESATLLRSSYDQPLSALADFCDRILQSDVLLRSFVNEVDAEWGRMYRERPHFQQEGAPPDEDDPYTFSSVRHRLTQLVAKLRQTDAR